MMLSLDTAYRSFGGEVEASSTPTICRLSDSRRHQLWAIAPACTEKHHTNHTHKHGPNCGHTAIRHDGHIDYLHDGHLHHMHEDHVDEHVIAANATNPSKCTPQVTCPHVHGPNCGHEAAA